MPKIGMRIVKSSVAVFLCFCIYQLRGEGTPFYSAIAALICMKLDVETSFKTGFTRIIGTFIGGIFGVVVLLAATQLWKLYGINYFFYITVISFMIIPIIYVTLLLKKADASYFSCVVFLSITVVHGFDVNPYIFAMNRVIDTLIGIIVSLVINAVHLPRRAQPILLACNLDQWTVKNDTFLKNYMIYRLHYMLKYGGKIIFYTRQCIGKALPFISEAAPKLPLIALHGAICYHVKAHKYLLLSRLPYTVVLQILQLIKKEGGHCFVENICHGALHIYYEGLFNDDEEKYYQNHFLIPLHHYICATPPDNQQTACIRIIDCPDRLHIYQKLLHQNFSQQVKCYLSKCLEISGEQNAVYQLEVVSVYASERNLIDKIKNAIGCTKAVIFTGEDEITEDIAVLDNEPAAKEMLQSPIEMQKNMRYLQKVLFSKRAYEKICDKRGIK